MVSDNVCLESIYKYSLYNTIRRIILDQNMHNHQKSQIESRRGAVHFTSVVFQLQHVIERVIDDIYRHYRTTHELFPAPLKL